MGSESGRSDQNKGLVGLGLRAQKVDKRLRPFAIENAKRVPCAICRNLVLPEKMAAHMRAFHE